MLEALRTAQEDPEEVPVGAVIVRHGTVIARAHNARESAPPDPTAHAEILCLRAAAQALGTRHLTDCEMYVTLEPCPMCAGAILQADLAACYFGASDPEQGCCGSVYCLPQDPAFTHRVPVAGGFLRERAEAQLKAFFEKRRTSFPIEGERS